MRNIYKLKDSVNEIERKIRLSCVMTREEITRLKTLDKAMNDKEQGSGNYLLFPGYP